MIFEKLSRADDRYREIEQMITLPEVVSNNKEYSKLMKEYKALTPIIEKYREYKETERPETTRDVGITSSRLTIDNDDLLPPFLRKRK